MSYSIAYDTETTGFFSPKNPYDHPSQPHLVQLSAVQVDLEAVYIRQSLNLIVKPEGWEIPPAASDIHGITTAMAEELGQTEKSVLTTFLNLWAGDADIPCPRIAHNAAFDKNIIAVAIARHYGQGPLLDQWLAGEDYCTMKEATPIVKARKKNGALKWPKLREAYWYFFNEDFNDAHTANADVVATLQVYFALQEHFKNAE